MPTLPPEFDPDIYRANNPDLAGLPSDQHAAHYLAHGMDEGRVCSVITRREPFLNLVPRDASLLEIGPYTAPAFSRPAHNVRYLDAFSTAQLKAKAAETGMDPGTIPEIDFVWTGQSYAELIRNPLDIVFSSHNIEHQPDLIRHLQQISSILSPSGMLFLVIPDRRYCFDHFLPDTNFADVLSAYYDRRIKHVAGSVFEHLMLTTHNEPKLHWQGNHGPPPLSQPISDQTAAALAYAKAKIEGTAGYLDTHAWHFTPSSFRHLMTILGIGGYIDFKIDRIYPTIPYSFEFYAVLSKTKADQRAVIQS